MSSDAPQRLGDLLDGIGARLGLARSADARTVWGRWREIVGDGVSEHAEPSSLRDGVLRVRTDSPAWANELAYLGPEIQRRANQLTGRPTVTEVRIWTGPGPIKRARVSNPPSPAEPLRSSRSRSSGRGIASAGDVDPRGAFERAKRAWEHARRSARR